MRPNKLRIGVLHYHFRRGGVRTVMINSLRALIGYGPHKRMEIDLIAGDAEQSFGREAAEELQHYAEKADGAEVSIRLIEIPELGYNDRPARDKAELFQDAGKLTDKLLRLLKWPQGSPENPYVLHVHNVNLGKNPRLTLALKLLSDRIEEQRLPARILYQMHDFAEDHRPACWAALRDCSGSSDHRLAVEMMYPTSPYIRWICINSTDREKLLRTGIKAERVEVLPNSVDVETLSAPPLAKMSREQLGHLGLAPRDFRADLKDRIGVFAEHHGFRFEPRRKILAAPIKLMRRKNVAESVLLLMALNARKDCYQLLVTLPPHSEADLNYARALEQFVKRHRLPAVLGFGPEILKGGHQRIIKEGRIWRYSLIDFIDLSEAVITTSIQEGFGYVFHEPWLMDRAAAGRNISSVTRDFIAEGMELGHLYDHLLIPKEWVGKRWEGCCREYYEKLQDLYQAAGMYPDRSEGWENRINRQKTYNLYNRQIKSEEMLDWADLSVELQLIVLKDFVEAPRLLAQMAATNKALEPITDWLNFVSTDTIEHNKNIVATQYNLTNKARRLTSLIDRCFAREQQEQVSRAAGPISNREILAQALEIENMRLII